MSKIRQKIWDVLREHKAEFLPPHEIAGKAGTVHETTHNYLNMLEKAGLIEVQLQGALFATRPIKTFRLLKNIGTQAPRLRADGSFYDEQQSEVIWRTAKILRRFTLAELVLHIGMTHQVKTNYVKNYVFGLVRGGYVTRHDTHFQVVKITSQAPKQKDLKP